MKYINDCNIKELKNSELIQIQGGGFFRRLGALCGAVVCAYENSGLTYDDTPWGYC